MKLIYLVYVLFIKASVQGNEEDCNKPIELKLKEELCWSKEIEVVDRIVQRSKNVLNFAKKKLGIDVVDENNEQKCDYYLCIFRELHMLNANDYPAYEAIQEWTKRNVIYFQAIGLMKQLDKCNDALTNSTSREINFYAKQIEEKASSEEDAPGSISKKEQSTCDIAAEFIDCLSRQKQCPIFQYP